MPAARAEPVAGDGDAVLLWTRTGSAQVDIAGLDYSLPAGRIIWVPPGLPMTVRTDPGTVAIPIVAPVSELPDALARVKTTTLPMGWDEWLTYHFARSAGYLRGTTSYSAGLLDLISGSPEPGDAESAVIAWPRSPRSPAACGVARELLRDPGHPLGLGEFALREGISTRTLQRQFTSETGLTFRAWRNRLRIAAAAALLGSGHSVAETARRCGYGTLSSFSRAFSQQAGLSPRQYRRQRATAANSDVTTASADEGFMEGVDTLTRPEENHSGRGTMPPSVPRHPLPASETWPRVNYFHVVVWVYRGTARIEIADTSRTLQQGDAMLLPAGLRNHVTAPEGSLLLPLGHRPGYSRPPDRAPQVIHLPAEAEDFLLSNVVANLTCLRPAGYDPHAVVSSFQRHVPSTAGDGSQPARRVIDALTRDPSDSRDLGDWAAMLGVGLTELRRAFFRETGSTFPVWRAELRMTHARALLASGDAPSTVARRVGYARFSGFTRAFTVAHGITPSHYRRQVRP
ncbi:helix-turn-helix domain-containing protein [Aeromicrobium sp. PE09-221]|uniref:helix-turn-helix domain-containing protein n=1 Tax=Aeromicrobium sp. PE09-221 TaxID=1898043 RepID=UPI00148297AC|nr:helix-turn-helix domain-containing protein [Aeromicrobium sp. PE09-221]